MESFFESGGGGGGKKKKKKGCGCRNDGGGKKKKNGCGCRNDGGDRWFPINNNMKPARRSKESGDDSLRRYPKYAAEDKMKGVVEASSCSLKPISEFDTRHSLRVPGGSSYEICVICEDAKPCGVLRRWSPCRHRYCDGCVAEHVRGKVKEDIHVIKCPQKDCNKTLDMGYCIHSLIDSNDAPLVDAWVDAEREAKVLGDPFRIKCPFLDCSRTFVDDGKKYLIRACPNCWRIVCLRCKVRWHMGMSCWQYDMAKKVKFFLLRRYGEDDEEEDVDIKEFAGLRILRFN